PDDYVIASEHAHSVREFVSKAFELVGLDYQEFVVVDDRFFRPAEVDLLLGDCSKARRTLGWRAQVDFESLVAEMVEADMETEQRNLRNREH
ncbi:MAG: GDP-mannose 4,6-dehydratase, partial [Arenicellales bacterium]